MFSLLLAKIGYKKVYKGRMWHGGREEGPGGKGACEFWSWDRSLSLPCGCKSKLTVKK